MARSWRSQIADEVRATSRMKPKWTLEELRREGRDIPAHEHDYCDGCTRYGGPDCRCGDCPDD